jgi:hypothetical protein
MRPDYPDWLTGQGYSAKKISDYLAMARRIETHYGAIETAVRDGRFDDLLDVLTYSTEDERDDRPNPSAFDIRGNLRNNLASYKVALRAYKRFLDATRPAK